ncbi:MAG: 1,4-dihydroxy-2-naphthoate polyprenyltransferase [Anaerolineae bacterium]|nr:1,4-dihydroxy-2-naphthoate polyprenyltransferase [Anaerolineae bacterium]
MAPSPATKSLLESWWLAIRPRTLPAAAAPVLVGAAFAFHDGVFQFWTALAALVGALLLQIGANLANDVFDFKKGADTAERLGPPRVTATGRLTSQQVLIGMCLVLGLATLIGLYLVLVGGWVILAIGVAAIICAVAYTGGPYPLGYHGLGDLFVFVFFGLAAVAGTYYVQALKVNPAVWFAAIPLGLLAVAILVVNNLRDIETDRAAGKHTMAVRLGAERTRVEYVLLLVLAYLIPLGLVLFSLDFVWVALIFGSVPLALPLVRIVRTEKGRALNAALAGTARLEFVYAVLFTASLVIARLI